MKTKTRPGHAQYQMNIDAPETKEAFTDIAKFFDRYLKQ